MKHQQVLEVGSLSSHSLRYFSMGVSEPGQGLPQFIAVGYVDDQPFIKYDSITKRAVPQVPWMEKVVEYDAGYWERQSRVLQDTDSVFRASLENLRERYNQSDGEFHILQGMYGCEVGPDRRFRGGNMQDAYDGVDFLTLDMNTLTWTALVPQAEETKRRWENTLHNALFYKSYLEGPCVEWLRRYLDYGSETLQRTEAPVARVACKKGYDGRETLFCQLYGFYPKEIEVTWMKDGEDRTAETLTGGVVPNSDGTYHTWLSIEVDPKEKDRYWCRVGHDSLLEPLELAWEEPAPNLWLLVGVFGVFDAILLGTEVALYIMKRSRLVGGYKATPASNLGLIVRVVGEILVAILLGIVVAPCMTSILGLIVGVVVGAFLAILLGIGVALYMKRRSRPVGGYKAPPGSDWGSDNSSGEKRSRPVGGYKATPASNLELIVGVLAGILAAILLGIVVALYMTRQHSRTVGGYKATLGSD
ncbi:UNVERIFIED_CONTAM: hypothetical protein K2H54_067548 [Gekko kuhli]